MFRIDAKQAKKFCFRFASFRFEAKMTAHPSMNQKADFEEKKNEGKTYSVSFHTGQSIFFLGNKSHLRKIPDNGRSSV
jgi:hypothetical protein